MEEKSMKCSTCLEAKIRWQQRIEETPNPRHRKMLEVALKHWWAEVVYDIDTVMATVTPDIVYRSYGTTAFGPPVVFDNALQARAMYLAQFDAGLMPGGPIDNERIALADWGFSAEGLYTLAFPGAALSLPDQTLDPEQLYLVQIQMSVITPFDAAGELMAGEILYMSSPLIIEPTDRDTIARLLGWDARTYRR